MGVVGVYGMSDLTDFQTKLLQTKYDSKSYTRSWQSLLLCNGHKYGDFSKVSPFGS